MFSASWEISQQPQSIAAYLRDGSGSPGSPEPKLEAGSTGREPLLLDTPAMTSKISQ